MSGKFKDYDSQICDPVLRGWVMQVVKEAGGQKPAGELLGISGSTVSKIVNKRPVSRCVRKKVAEALDGGLVPPSIVKSPVDLARSTAQGPHLERIEKKLDALLRACGVDPESVA